MTLLARLPTEVMLIILQYTDDFIGLESLMRSYPRAEAIFRNHPLLLTESLLSSNPMLSYKLHRLFRATARLRIPLICGIDNTTWEKRMLSKPKLRDLAALHGFNSLMLDMVRIAARIQRLACACLTAMLRNLRSAVSANPCLPIARERRQLARPVWIEEYRVYRALWHLQYYAELRQAAADPCRWDWPRKYQKKLDRYDKRVRDIPYLEEDIRSVSEVIRYMVVEGPQAQPQYTKKRQHSSSALHTSPNPSPWDRYFPVSTQLQMPPPYFPSLQMKKSLEAQFPSWPAPLLPGRSTAERLWHRSTEYSAQKTTQCHSFNILCATEEILLVRDLHFPSLFQGAGAARLSADLSRYRKLGVFLWDRWRMYSIGLVERPSRRLIVSPEGERELGMEGPDVEMVDHEEWMTRWSSLMLNHALSEPVNW